MKLNLNYKQFVQIYFVFVAGLVLSAEPDLVASTKNSRACVTEDNSIVRHDGPQLGTTADTTSALLSSAAHDLPAQLLAHSNQMLRNSQHNCLFHGQRDAMAILRRSSITKVSMPSSETDAVLLAAQENTKLSQCRTAYTAIPCNSQSLPASSEPPKLPSQPLSFARKHKSHPVLLHISVVEPTKGIDHIGNIAQTLNNLSETHKSKSCSSEGIPFTSVTNTLGTDSNSKENVRDTHCSGTALFASNILNAVNINEAGLVMDTDLLSCLAPAAATSEQQQDQAAMPPPPVAPPRKRRRKRTFTDEVSQSCRQPSSFRKFNSHLNELLA